MGDLGGLPVLDPVFGDELRKEAADVTQIDADQAEMQALIKELAKTHGADIDDEDVSELLEQAADEV